MNITEDKIYKLLIILIVVCSFFSVFSDIMEPDGALYATIAKTMLINGDWLNLYVNGTDWLDKPHLTFWLSALSFKVFGIHAFAYKLPSFLVTLLGAGYLYGLSRHFYNQKTALTSVLIFLSALHLLISNFDVRAESYLCAFVVAAVYHYYSAQERSFWHIVAGSFFTACAIMVKGIFVVAPIFSGFVLYWALTHQYHQFLKFKWWIAIVLIFIFIVPELYALYIQFDLHPEKLVFGKTGVSGIRFFFWDSQFGRFMNNGPIKGKGDVSFFLHTNLWAFLPWSVLFYAAVCSLAAKKTRAKYPPESIILWSASLVTFLMFSFSKFQLPHYIIILFPFFAMITAVYLENLKPKPIVVFYFMQTGLLILVSILLIAITLLFGFRDQYLCIGLLIVLALFAFLWFGGRSVHTIIGRSALLSLSLAVFLYLFFYPSLVGYQAGMQAGKWLKANHPSAQVGVFMSDNAFSFSFYANQTPVHFDNLVELRNNTEKRSMIVYMPKYALSMFPDVRQSDILKTFDNYHITKLKLKFLNKETRASTFDQYCLVKIN